MIRVKFRYIDGRRPQIGDLVELVDDKGKGATAGARAVVINLDREDGYIDLKWVDTYGVPPRGYQRDGYYFPFAFRLVERHRSVSLVVVRDEE